MKLSGWQVAGALVLVAALACGGAAKGADGPMIRL
jgi:hypothetical protein